MCFCETICKTTVFNNTILFWIESDLHVTTFEIGVYNKVRSECMCVYWKKWTLFAVVKIGNEERGKEKEWKHCRELSPTNEFSSKVKFSKQKKKDRRWPAQHFVRWTPSNIRKYWHAHNILNNPPKIRHERGHVEKLLQKHQQ